MCVRSHLVATELVAFHHCGRGTGELGVWDWYVHLRHEGGGEETYFIHLRGREGGREGGRERGREEEEKGRREGKREEGEKEREGLKTRVHPTSRVSVFVHTCSLILSGHCTILMLKISPN